MPKDIIIWEGLLGILSDPKATKKSEKYARKSKWNDFLTCFVTNELLARKITDLTYRFNASIEILSFISQSEEYREALERRVVDVDQLAVGPITVSHPLIFTRNLTYMPYVRSVWFADPQFQFRFGSKGRFLDPAKADQIGMM